MNAIAPAAPPLRADRHVREVGELGGPEGRAQAAPGRQEARYSTYSSIDWDRIPAKAPDSEQDPGLCPGDPSHPSPLDELGRPTFSPVLPPDRRQAQLYCIKDRWTESGRWPRIARNPPPRGRVRSTWPRRPVPRGSVAARGRRQYSITQDYTADKAIGPGELYIILHY
jgi:hypothetical protein